MFKPPHDLKPRKKGTEAHQSHKQSAASHHIQAIQIQSLLLKADVAIKVGCSAPQQGCMHFGRGLVPKQLLLAHLHQLDNVSLVRTGQLATLQALEQGELLA